MNEPKSVNIKIDHGRLSDLARPTPKPDFVGRWSTIEFQPNFFAPQRFTVGVVVQSTDDHLHFKLLDDFRKFDCIYPNIFPLNDARDLMAYADEALSRAVQSRTPIHQMHFDAKCLSMSHPVHTSGSNPEATVERLFSEVVAMAPLEKERRSNFVTIDTNQVRRLVNVELKEIAGPDFERFVIGNPKGLLVEGEGRGKQYLDLNLLTPRACGSVISAVYKSPHTVESKLLKTSLDLKTCMRRRELQSIGLFLLLPNPKTMEPQEFRRIEAVIRKYAWKLEQDGFRVVGLPEPEGLARAIFNWALPTLQ